MRHNISKAGDLKKVIIKKDGNFWHVIREREENGEAAVVETLEDAFDYVRILYDETGKQKEPVTE